MFPSPRACCAVVALAVALAAPARAADDAKTVETTLDNGVRVVLQPRHAVPMVAITALVGAGSALEDASFSGASHYLEHLLFNGTSTMTQDELYDAVARIGGYNNAHTDEDHTYFTMLVPSEHAARGLEIQAAMLFDSTLPPQKFDKERGIVLEELARDRSRPGHAAEVALRGALWAGTPYARPVIGTEDSLTGIDLDRIRTYWTTHYVPGNVLLWVVGDFEPGAMLEAVDATYGEVERPGGPPALPDAFAGLDGATYTAVPVDDPTPRVAIALPAPGPCEPNGAAVDLLATVLSSESGPLRSALGPDVATSLSAYRVARPVASALVVRADLAEGADAKAAAIALLAALDGVARDGLAAPGVTAEAILRAARAARADRALSAQRLHYVGMLRSDAVASCSGSVVPVVAPERAPDPTPADVAAAAHDVLGGLRTAARVVLVGPGLELEGPATLEEVWTAPPAPGTVAAAAIPGVDLDRTLPDGLRVVVRREPDALATGIHVLVRDRAAREPAGLTGIADVLHRLLPSGTALSDRGQLESRLERIGAQLKTADSDFLPYDDYYTSPSHSFVRLEVPAEHWLPALDLVAELLRLPRLADDDLAALLPTRITRAEQVAGDPSEAGDLAYRLAMLGVDHPWARPVEGEPDTLAAIDGEILRGFATAYLAPEGLVVSVVGPHHPEDVAGAIAERFPSEPAGVSWTPMPPWPATDMPGDPVRVELGAEQSRLSLGRIADVDPDDRAALELLAAVLSERLGREVREGLGLAYSIGAGVTFRAGPDRAWMTISMGTRPDNLDTALDAVRATMTSLARDMADTAELDTIRAERRGRALMRRMAAINRARLIGLRAWSGVASDEDVDVLDAVDRVTRDDLVKLASSWLDPERFRVVVAR